ncbi:MAG TPA: hypothetical protein VMA54_20905 [Steroidobacteraceae bacterium]|nr:hypothetical protein [Steroidobacteraceae bacterium]HUA26602.1 hypothetical protein [Steroidobacteraceae bacterium]
MNLSDQRICLWLVPVFGVLLVAAFCIAGFIPPPAPTLTAQEVANFYRDHIAQIRAGMIAVNLCGIMFIPFFMVIVVQMQRMANPSRAFAYAYLSAAASAGSIFLLADLAWSIAAFRPERDPQLIMLMNDLAWMSFVSPVGFIMAQNFVLALGIYMDVRQNPVFARWVGHFNILTALLMMPGAFALKFRAGPLAWDGSLAFGLHFGTFGVYIAVMFFVVRSALARQAHEEGHQAREQGAEACPTC